MNKNFVKNFVRILALILAGLMVLSLIPLVSYGDWCEHPSWSTIIVEPVCGEDGYSAARCDVCGFEQGVEIIPHTEEHDFSACVESEDYLISEGSCTEPTLYFKSCSKCGYIAEFYYYQALEQMQKSLWEQYQREVAYHGGEVTDWNLKLQQATEEVQNRYIFKVGGEGHRFSEVEAQPATCTSDGWTAYQVCADCGEIEGYETVPAKGHRFGEFVVTKAPTCTETGVQERVCEVCGEKETETVPALGHKGPFTSVKAPTCTEAGSEKRICTVCGAEEVREVAPLGHKGPFTVTKEATCTEDGVQERDCTVCGAHEVVAIPAAHKFGENSICTVCGAAKTGTETESTLTLSLSDTAVFKSGEGDEEQPEENGEPAIEDTDVFEAGGGDRFNNPVVQVTDNQAMVGETLTATVEPNSLEYEYQWIREVNGNYSNINGATGPTYTLTTSDCPYTVYCSVNEKGVPQPAKLSNGVHVRQEITYNVTIKGEGSVTIMDKDGVLQESSAKIYNYPAEEGRTFSVPTLTENEITITARPNDAQDYYIRSVKVNNSTVIPASKDAKTYIISSVPAGTATRDVEIFFDIPFCTAEKNPTLEPDVRYDSDPSIRRSFEETYAKNGEPFAYYYVTPHWDSAPAAPISASDITAVGGFTFTMDLPDGVNSDNYSNFEVHVYHYASATGTWESVPFVKVEGEPKVEVQSFTHFSPFAVLAKQSCTLSFDKGDADATGTMDPVSRIVGEKVTIPKCGFTAPAGKTFAGWKNAADPTDTTDYSVGKEIELKKNITLTAQWIGGYTISFDDNDNDNADTYGATVMGEMSPVSVPADRDREDKVLGNKLSLKNHEFMGWSLVSGTDNGADETKVISDTATLNDFDEFKTRNNENSDVTLYAVWKRTYSTITFNANGGSGTMADQTAHVDNMLTLNKNAYTAPSSSKVFAGWSETASGNVKYTDAATIDTPATDITLYAVWKDKVVIHFNPTSTASGEAVTGTGTMADQTIPSGEETALKANSFTAPSGMAFKEWNTKQDGTGTAYKDEEKVTLTGETYLYAQWRKDAAIITFEANGGNGTMEPQEMEKNVATPLNPNTYTPRAGMGFNGWNTRADGSGTSFKDKATVRVTRDITLYAQWINACTITFNANGGSGTMDNQVVETGKTTALNANTYTRINYEFEGWTTNPDGTGERYANQGNVNTDKDITLYAVWKQIAYAITYDANGGGGTQMAQQNVPIGNTATIRDNAYNAKPGEVFAYWEDQNGTHYNPGDKIEPTADLALKAVWVEKLTISYYPGEGSGVYNEGEAPKDVPTDIKTASEAKFTAPAGSTFAYWQDDNGNRYYEGRQYAFPENTKLTAVWAPAMTITFNKNASDATGTMATQTVGSGVETALNANRFSRSDYIFKYWTKTKSDPYPGQDPNSVTSSDVYKDGANIIVNQNTTLYAQWYKTAITQNAVAITGDLTGLNDFAVWGETLTAVVNDPVLKSGFNYNWLVDGNSVKEGTDNTYEVKKEDYGKTVICEVTHPQATNKVESNTKIVGTYAEDEDLIIINNGDPNYPYSKYAYVYGVVPGTTFTKDGRDYLVPDDADGYMEIAYPGVYTFGYATYNIENWYTVGYEVDNSGSGTVTMKNGSTTLTSNVPSSMRDDIQYYGNNVWLVRQGSVTELSITMKPASSTYVHWNINGGSYSSSATEVTRRLGNINQPILFTIVFNKSSSSPKTGDMSHLGMWSALCFTSLVGAAGTIGASRRRRKSGK